MTYFFDNHHSPEIVKALRLAEVDAIHLREKFPKGADDLEWIPVVGENRWILITGDWKLLRRREEKRAFRAARIVAFFVSKTYNNKHALVRMRWMLNQWEKIEREAKQAELGDCFEVPYKGKIEKMIDEEEGE